MTIITTAKKIVTSSWFKTGAKELLAFAAGQVAQAATKKKVDEVFHKIEVKPTVEPPSIVPPKPPKTA